MNATHSSRAGAFHARNLLATVLGLWADSFRVLGRTLGPLVDLGIRLWIAQIFLVSGILKLGAWDTALFLSATEYPVSWLDPVTAAYLGVTVEIAGAILLALGLATRAAALPMLFLAIVIQANYVALDEHLFWGALLGWFLVRGAGPLSLDAFIARGLGDTAIPFAGRIVRFTRWLGEYGAPVWLLALRAWLGAALVAAALGFRGYDIVLPMTSAAAMPLDPAVLVTGAILLVLGFAARIVGVVFVLAAFVAIMGSAGGAGASASGLAWWIAALALPVLAGPGPISIDAWIASRLRRIFPQLDGKPAFSLEGLPRVVIVGAGFGGLACAARLRRLPVQVTLIDRHNYHLFQPLLYQVATAGLSPGDIASTVRELFRDHFNVRVVLGTVTGVDTARRDVLIGEQRIPFDYLVLATGASHSYFGKDEWEPHAPGLKRVEDATEVRRRVLLAFERAESTDDEAERRRQLTFLIVGGGPTGVELAGAIAELARFGMQKDFRRFDPAAARIILVQSGARILPTFEEALSAEAKRALEALGVEVRINSRVEKIDAEGVFVSGERIEARTVLWAAGVVASPAARWLGTPADSAGRVKVGDDLSVPGLSQVFAIGDTALAGSWNGNPVPGLAPAAKQGGVYVADVIRARVLNSKSPGAFRYKHLGSLATIGRKAAVVDFGFIRLSGAIAWWLWGLVHVGFLVGLRNRVSVMLDWFWAYLTFRSGTRLITGGEHVDAAPAVRSARAA